MVFVVSIDEKRPKFQRTEGGRSTWFLLYLSFPGFKFCKGMHFNISCYLIGSIWISLTAIYRVLYIKGPNWIKNKIGEKRLLNSILFIGLCLVFTFASLLVFSDEESLTLKLCNHHAGTYLEILSSYKVQQNSAYNIYSVLCRSHHK